MNRRDFSKRFVLGAAGLLVPRTVFPQILVRGGSVRGATLGQATASGGVTPSPLVISATPGSARTDTHNVGLGFTAQSTVTIVSLGRWVFSGNTGTHTISLMNSAGTVLAFTTIATSGATSGAFAYNTCTPFTLVNGTQYFIISVEGSGDTWGDTSTIACNTSVTGTGGSAWYSAVADSGVPGIGTFGESYVPVSALFTP